MTDSAPDTRGLQGQPDPPVTAAPRCDGYEWRGDIPRKCQLPLGHKAPDGTFLERANEKAAPTLASTGGRG